MSSTYTPSLTLTQIGNGEQSGTWGTTTNTNWQLIEDSVAGVATVSVSGTTGATLSVANGATDQSRKAVIIVNGATSGTNVIVAPLQPKVYVVSNQTTGGFSINIGASTGSIVTIPNGVTTLVYCDGTNFSSGITGFTGGNLSISGNITATGTVTAPLFTGNLSLSGSGPTGGGGAAGQIPYQTGANTTNWTPVPTTGSYLTWTGSAYSWSTGSVTTATNLANGTSKQIPIQAGPNSTTFITAPSAANQILTYDGSNVLWASGGAVTSVSGGTTGLTPSTPTTSAVVLGGILNVANGGTQLSSSGASGNLLVSNGSAWVSQSPATAGLLTTSTGAALSASNVFTGSASFNASGGIGDQRVAVTGSGQTTGLSPGSIQLGASGFGMYYTTSPQAVNIITPGFGGNAAFYNTGYNYQGNNNASWQTTSDVNIKTNIHSITGVLDKISALNPTHFEYKDKLGETRTGFIAQEFETVFPGHVADEIAEEKYLQYLPEGQTTIKTLSMDLVPYLVKAIQELNAKVDAQAAEIAALKGA